MTGKASFVMAQVNQTNNALAEVYDRRGRPLGTRMLAYHKLETEPPRTGMQGWDIFAEQTGPTVPAPRPPLVRLECGFCGHLFFVEIHRQEDTEGEPASYAASWFSFMDRSYQGEPALACPRCEQSSAPGVQFLSGPR